MKNLVSTKRMLGAILALTIIALLSGCGGSKVEEDTALENISDHPFRKGYASSERLVTAKWVADNLDNEKVKIIDGSLKGLRAIYQASDGPSRSHILLTFMQQNQHLSINNQLLK